MTKDELIKALQESKIAGDDKITHISISATNNEASVIVDKGYLEEFYLYPN